MTSTKKSKTRAMPMLPTSSTAPCLAHSLQNEDWPAEAQKVKDEQMQAFYQEYIKTVPEKGTVVDPDDHIRRLTTALTQYTSRGMPEDKAVSEEFLRQGSEHILTPSPEELMELYATVLRENLDLNPKMKEILTDQNFAASTLLHGEELIQHFRHHQQRQHAAASQQHAPCGCGVDHGDEALGFPEDSYEDEPDEEEEEEDDEGGEGDEGEEDDGEEEEEEEESMDDEEYDDDDGQDVVDGYAHHYEENSIKMMAYEEEKLKLETVRRVREEERRLKEEFRKKRLSERIKQKQEKERIQLLQRLRLEDEERRRREVLEKQRREKLEEEMRKKREAAEADQKARSFLFQCTMRSQVETVKQIISATPDESCSLTGVPRFVTTAATRLFGWEFMTMVEGVGEVSEEKGVQETLLHVAVRVGCVDLAIFFISKGAPLDALDKDGLTPLHTAAKHSSPFEICKVLVEKTAHHIDQTCILDGKTALHYAAQTGYADLVLLLLQYHARINPQDLKGNTPEFLAKVGLESVLSEKSTKANTKQANATKAQKFRNVIQHLQKAIIAAKEAQSRKDAQLEEQRRRDEALAREEAEKDNAARRKQEEKLEADLRRRLEEEKELERLKAIASDPSGNNNTSNKKKKKKKGGNKNEAASTAKETPPITSSPSKKGKESFSELSNVDTKMVQSSAESTSISNQPIKIIDPPLPTAKPSGANTKPSTSAKIVSAVSSQPTIIRIPKPKTTYRPSQLVVTRMTDMGFPLRESRKALIQTEGRVEDAIDLLTSGAQLADDSEDEAEQAAERAKAKAAKLSAMNAKAQPAKSSEGHVNGHANIVRSPQQPNSDPAQNHHAQSTSQQQQQSQAHQRTFSQSHAPLGMQQISPRPANHPVQILQRTQAVAPHVQSRSVPTQVLQRPSAHVQQLQHPQSHINAQIAKAGKSLSSQGAVLATLNPVLHQTPAITGFIAPRAAQPISSTRTPYSYGPATPYSHNSKPLTPSVSTSHVNNPNLTSNRIPVSPSASGMDRSVPGHGPVNDAGAIGVVHKLGDMNLSDHQGFGTGSDFSGFAAVASTWDVSIGSKGPVTSASQELPMPMSAGYQSSPMTGHNLWSTSGLPLSTTSLLSNVADNNIGSAFGSPFLTSLPTAHHQQQQTQCQPVHQPTLRQQQHPGSSVMGSPLDGLQAFGDNDLDLGNAGDEMIKDVLAMTGAIDSEEFAELQAEYSLLGSGPSNNSNSNGTSSNVSNGPSRTVGDGRNSNQNSNSGQPMASLWDMSTTGSFNGEGNHGLPSPIGPLGGHARRGMDSGFNGNDPGHQKRYTRIQPMELGIHIGSKHVSILTAQHWLIYIP
ncbi:hypothetical protein BCR41DRAFT_355789 [Lobosporangium transversale]|uniref:UBA domain-containing protein n=1 Tax=Lobosporangium transversale TaxID=64571 RepID=A0A1Y2GKA6_9FUNG|nr:hypothetical protein BCR41DRAFT_355789 [Lobosporangium transversale]ORZ13449.1 hypothetical protein BCR41DRAFT_355789 [Lobosporangium transversale]|eukprot:XP_021880530.1 hypothetical protein BCR41DRAFT_355789 [Lobosporangium transversale]